MMYKFGAAFQFAMAVFFFVAFVHFVMVDNYGWAGFELFMAFFSSCATLWNLERLAAQSQKMDIHGR